MREGDAVNAGDLLLELRDDEQRTARAPARGRSGAAAAHRFHSTAGAGHPARGTTQSGTGQPRAAAPRNAVRAQAAGFRAAGAGAPRGADRTRSA
nr:hypothetical protein [Stutzerimonas stutzeri]